MERKAVVAGGTGLIGQELVRMLLENAAYASVTVLVRKPLGRQHPKLRERIVDFERLEEAQLDLGGADLFCALGTTIGKAGSQEAFRQVDYAYPLALGQLAKRAGAPQMLIVTSMGASSASRIFYSRVKGEIEDALLDLGFAGLHIFRPSLLLGEREEFRLGEKAAAALSGLLPVVFSGPLRKYKPIPARSVARAMLLAALCGATGVHVYESDAIERMAQAERGR
nr:oxidoreductase [Paenibacillus hamazuiensis]